MGPTLAATRPLDAVERVLCLPILVVCATYTPPPNLPWCVELLGQGAGESVCRTHTPGGGIRAVRGDRKRLGGLDGRRDRHDKNYREERRHHGLASLQGRISCTKIDDE